MLRAFDLDMESNHGVWTMTNAEFDEMAALVVRLRKQVGIEQARATHESRERHALVLQLSAHIDALKQSNAQCGEYLQQNEQLQNKLAETTKALAYSRLTVATMCARDKRFAETIAKYGAKDGEDIGDFIERSCVERKTLHSELVDVRAALASVSAERDSLKRTLQEWEEAETKPHARAAADDIADHVAPPLPLCMKCHDCGSALEQFFHTGPLYCTDDKCDRTNTLDTDSPYNGQCSSAVRHE
jgi:chromosome segregation ATPase